jgi:hypothetical protein
LYHKTLAAVFDPFSHECAFFQNRAVENGRDTLKSGRHGREYSRPLGVFKAPEADLHSAKQVKQ